MYVYYLCTQACGKNAFLLLVGGAFFLASYATLEHTDDDNVRFEIKLRRNWPIILTTVRTVLKGNPRLLAKGYVKCPNTQFSYCGSLAHSIMYKIYS